MPGRTLSDKVDELSGLIAYLTARIENLDEKLTSLGLEVTALTSSKAEQAIRIALLEHQLAEMKKANEERDRRLWMIGGSLFVAIIGTILTFLLRK